MLFNNVDKNTKIEIIQENIPKYEKKVYTLLVELGIDPDNFNNELFEVNDSSVDSGDLALIDMRQNLKKALDALEILNNQILSLEE
jgi:hypothetical protein